MEPQKQLTQSPADAEAECRAVFGFSADLPVQAVTQGWLDRQTRTRHHSRNFPGVVFQGESTGALRRLLEPLGWAPYDRGSFAAVASPDGRTRIVVRSANERTGLGPLEPFPICNNRNGRMLRDVVNANRRKLRNSLPDLFSPDVLPFPVAAQSPAIGVDTYLLLIHVDRSGGPLQGQIRSELSLPVFRDDNGRIAGFQYRILLPAITPSRGASVPEQADIPSVLIVPKAG